MTVERDYRARIYERYTTARDQPLAPQTLAALRPRLPYLRRVIRKHFPDDRDAAILDLGCGHGALLYALRLDGYRNARGMDRSHEQVEAARRLGIDGVSEGDFSVGLQSISDESLDVLVAFDLIEHLTKKELVRLVDEARRVLRPEGRWVIHAPNGGSPFGGRIRYGDFTHELAFTRTSLAQLLMSSGFSKVNCFEDRPIVHGAKSFVRRILWWAIRTGMLLYIAAETGEIDGGAIFSQNLLAVAWKPGRATEGVG